MRVVIRPDLSRVIRHHPTLLRDDLHDAAQRIVGEAKAIASAEAYETGDYLNGLEARVELDGDGIRGQAVATDEASVFIEFGTQHMPPEAPLRRAAERTGFRLQAHRR